MLIRLAWRNLWRQRRRTFITLASILFGVALTTFLVALAEGVYARLVDEALRLQAGHAVVQHPRYLEEPSVDLLVDGVSGWRERASRFPGVARIKASTLAQCLVKSAHGSVGAALHGVEPGAERATSPIVEHLVEGRYLEDADRAAAVVGVDMAERLQLRLGAKIVVTANDVNGDLVEELCRVRGIFRTGAGEADGHLVQVPLRFARRLLAVPGDAATQVGIILEDGAKLPKLLGFLGPHARAGGVAVRTWSQVMPDVAGYVQVDRVGGRILESLVLFLILFTIFNTTLMSVLERRREFAVLLALGTPPGMLRRQVVTEAAFLNVLGCAAGLLVGGLAALYFGRHGINLEGLVGHEFEIAGLAVAARLHPAPTWGQIAAIGSLVLTVSVALSLYPVWIAPRVRVAEAIRSGL